MVQAVFWDSLFDAYNAYCRWEYYGLEVHVPDKYYFQEIHFSTTPELFHRADKIHKHLTTGKCDCKGVCYIKTNLGPGDRYALANLLTDLSQIYLKLDKSPRWFGDSTKKYRYDLEDGLQNVE